MKPKFRRWIKFALIGVAAVVLGLVLAWLALPGILQSQAEKYIAEKTGHRLTLARPEIDPLALSIRLRDLRLIDPAGAPLLAFSELLVDVSATSLSRRTVVFDAIRLDGLSARVVQRKTGGLNWNPLLESLKSHEPKEDTGLPRLDIRQLRLGGAQIEVSDERVTPAFVTRIEPLDLELADVSTLPDDAGRFKLSAKTSFGAHLAWAGEITLNPLASRGRIDLGAIDLARLAPWLRDKLPIAPPAGIAALGADYRLSQVGDKPDLKLDHLALLLTGLRVQPAPGAAAPQLAIERVAAKDGHFDLASRQLSLGAIELQGSRLEAVLAKPPRAAVLRLDDVVLSEAKLDLARRQATLAAVRVKGGGFELRRDALGRIDLLQLVAGWRPAPSPEPATAGAPWRWRIAQVALNGFAVALRDEGVTPPLEMRLEDIGIAIEGVSENLQTALPLKASFAVNSGGRAEIAGQLTPADGAAEFSVKLDDLGLKPAQPYIAKFAALDFVSGQLAAAGRVTRNAKGIDYRGSFALRDLRLDQAGTKNLFLAWKTLGSDAIELSPSRLDIALLSLDGLDTQLIINADKTTNLKGVLRPQPAAVSPAPTSAPARAAAPGFQVDIERLRFRRGELDFADLSLMLPFATRIHGLRGSIVGLSSQPGAGAKYSQVELDGEVDEFGLARAVGQLDFFKPTDFMDMRVIFRNVEMTRLTPYAATFAGRKIDSGKLSLDLQYKIRQRQLQSENQVVMDRLVLGERVESPTAKDLPLDLAVALLSDADGRIDLGLPVSGSLDDPQFSYGQLVWKAITNLLGRIVAAPFRALGALFGGSGEKLDSIAFEAGAARLTPPEREKLLRLATALGQRPGLALSVQGAWGEADRVALQDRQLRRAVAAKSGQSVGEKGDPGPLSTRSAKTQEALESLFAERFGRAELSALKEGFRAANPGQLEENLAGRVMSRLSGLIGEKRSLSEAEVGQLKGADFYAVLFERLRAKEEVKDDVLEKLAARRVDYALEQLKAAGAPAERIRQGAVEKSTSESGDIPLRLELGKAGE